MDTMDDATLERSLATLGDAPDALAALPASEVELAAEVEESDAPVPDWFDELEEVDFFDLDELDADEDLAELAAEA